MQNPAAEELRSPDASPDALRTAVEEAQRDRGSLQRHANAIREVVYRLDQGTLRVAEKGRQGWEIHGWIQQAINLFFGLAQSEHYAAGDLHFFDKVPPKQQLGDFRVVPPGSRPAVAWAGPCRRNGGRRPRSARSAPGRRRD